FYRYSLGVPLSESEKYILNSYGTGIARGLKLNAAAKDFLVQAKGGAHFESLEDLRSGISFAIAAKTNSVPRSDAISLNTANRRVRTIRRHISAFLASHSNPMESAWIEDLLFQHDKSASHYQTSFNIKDFHAKTLRFLDDVHLLLEIIQIASGRRG